MTRLADPPDWTGPSGDPNDEQFGDAIDGVALAEAGEYDAVLVGEPYDGAVIGRRGARDGPAAIREALAGLTTHHVTGGPVATRGDAAEGLAIADCGDVAVQAGDVAIPDGEAPDAGDDVDELGPDSPAGDRAPGGADDGEDAIPRADVASVQSAVCQVTNRVHDLDALPVFLGGDNSLTYPNAAPLLDRGSLGAISLDAHLDCRAVRDEPTSGTPYRQLHEDGLDAFAVLGARDFETSTAYHDFVAERGGTVLSARRVEQDPDAAASAALDATAGTDAVHLTIDLDVVDAAAAPGVSAPTPGGLSPRTLCSIVETLVAAPRVASVEVVELAPRLDEGGRTADLAAHVVAHALAGLARRRSAGRGGGTLRSDGGRPRRRRVRDGTDRRAASPGLEEPR